MMETRLLSFLILVSSVISWEYYSSGSSQVDLQEATIVIPENPSVPLTKAVNMLVDEVYKRTVVQLPVTNNFESEFAINTNPVIYVSSSALPNLKVFSSLKHTDNKNKGRRISNYSKWKPFHSCNLHYWI